MCLKLLPSRYDLKTLNTADADDDDDDDEEESLWRKKRLRIWERNNLYVGPIETHQRFFSLLPW